MRQNIGYKVIASVILIIGFIVAFFLFQEFNKFILEGKTTFILAGTLVVLMVMLAAIVFFNSGTTKIVRIIEEIKTKETVTEKYEEENIKKTETKDIEELSEKLIINVDNFKDAEKLGEQVLRNFAKAVSIVQGMIFIKNKETEKFTPAASYAFYSNEDIREFALGEGISGQVAKNQQLLNVTNIPEGYITVLSGLGSESPENLLIIPVVFNEETIAVIEVASFIKQPEYIDEVISNISVKLGEVFSLVI